MSHSHSHKHENKNLKVAFFLNLAFTFLELIGGFYVNSVSILSDALHDLGDSLSLGISWYLQRKSKSEADRFFTFGYSRFSLLGALINSVILIAGSIFIINEAIARFFEPQEANAQGMIILAIIGVAVNGYAAWKLSHGKSLNEKVVSWHLIEDVLGWTAVLIVAIVLNFKYIPYLDPALSILITLFVLFNVVKRLRQTFLIFLQGTPKEINADEIIYKIKSLDKVKSLHHTHIWSLEGESHVITTHVMLRDIHEFKEMAEVKKKIREILKPYNFSHFTIELELSEEDCSLNY
ncbi:MAG: cation diffusion facilitator family transporter [Cytophagales bacterium]